MNGTSWQRERIVSGSGPSSSATSTITAYGGRLLEILEQRVGGLGVHQVRAEDEVDAAIGLERPHVQVAPQLADRVDADLVAERLQHVEVGVRAALDAASRRRAARPRARARRGACRPRPARAGGTRARAPRRAPRGGGASPPPAQERSRTSPRISSAISLGGPRAVDLAGSAAGRCPASSRYARSTASRNWPALALDPVALAARAAERRLRRDARAAACGRAAAPLDRGQVQLEHAVDPEPARDALVGERRVEVAVAEHVVAALERRARSRARRARRARPRTAPPRPTARSRRRRAAARERAPRAASRRARASRRPRARRASRACRSSSICVVLPEPSRPSKVTNMRGP